MLSSRRYQLALAVAVMTVIPIVAGVRAAAIYGQISLVQAGYVATILSGLIASLIISRHPHNTVGLLVGAFSVMIGISVLPFAYGAPAYVSHRGSWPGGQFALWVDAWLWIVPFGLSLPVVLPRFPDGRVPRGWSWVGWLAAGGVVLLVLWAALNPGPMFPFGIAPNPFGLAGGANVLAALGSFGLVLLLVAHLGAAASVIDRYRRSRGDERQQIKWIGLAGAILGVTVLYAVAATVLFHQPLLTALFPFSVAALAGPAALGIAILRYRLYDIDLIINRTLVYGALTAILAGIYAGGVTLFQRLYLFISGQKSDATLVITAFAIAVLFSPIRDRLQKLVDRHLGGGDPVQALDSLSVSIESVLRVVNAQRGARRLVDIAAAGYQARYSALFLYEHSLTAPLYSHGQVTTQAALSVAMRFDGQEIGRLELGPRRGAQDYSERDRRAVERSLSAIAEALSLAREFGHALAPAEANSSTL